MQELGPAKKAPTVDEIIAQCGQVIADVAKIEASDDMDPDRIWLIRKVYKSFLYFHDLQGFVPSVLQGLGEVTGNGGGYDYQDDQGNGENDYSQNLFRGNCRKLEAVLGNRMPNCIAVPNNPDDEADIKAAKSANMAAQYIRQHCNLPMKMLFLVFNLFKAGTTFWHLEYEVDGDKYGTKQVPEMTAQPAELANLTATCQRCGNAVPLEAEQPPPEACAECGTPMGVASVSQATAVDVPQTIMKQVPKGGLAISLHTAAEISVPLDSEDIEDCEDPCDFLRMDREKSKAKLLKKWKEKVRDSNGVKDSQNADISSASQYAESVRSAFGSPVGIVRPKRSNRWTESDLWWTPAEYELIEDKAKRTILQKNFPRGCRITSVRGNVVDIKEEVLADRWVVCKPEPTDRIMGDPLGDDWLETTDINNDTLNQCYETVARSNQAGFYDPTRIDSDAIALRRSLPGEMIPAIRPAGGRLDDIVSFPPPLTFSNQIEPWVAGRINQAKDISGLTDAVTGSGVADEPTARQAELKKNAALQQLGVTWAMMGKSLEKVYMKSCRLLAEYEDGVLAFTKKDQFGQYATLSVVIDDLRNGKYHFEADEAIPMTWGQQRDLLMWMLDKPQELLMQWGLDDPLNIAEFKRLLGMPGQRIPLEDEREAGMQIIGELLKSAPVPGPAGPPGPDGQPTPGQPQASIQPQWEDNHAFLANLAKAYIKANPEIATAHPEGYQNLQLWGQAQEAAANVPQAPPPPKSSVALSIKGTDLGSPAVQAALQSTAIIPEGTQVESDTDKALALQQQQNSGMMPPPQMPQPAAPPV